MTVSNVINQRGRVGMATRERVLAAIARLGYVPNQSARRLVGSAVAHIGLIYTDVESIFIDAMLAAVAVVAAERGIQLHIRPLDHAAPERITDVARDMVAKGAQALLLLPPYAEMMGEDAHRLDLGVPIAAIATAAPLPNISTVRIDNRAAARAITDHLIAKGRRQIAMVTGPRRHSDSVARVEGYRDALAAAGLAYDPRLCVDGDFTFPSGLVAAEMLLGSAVRPDAIVAGNDDMAAAILWVAHQRGLALPRDLSVTGFDDTMIATRVWPQLTTIRQPLKMMATEAMACLAQAVREPDHDHAPRDIILPFLMVERASVL
ncbi:LacI family DNA-binding transcriptional regulator [Sphingomonas abietis]|uniref:Substrate-binding domain-containing protein n=1 Tax=Sphingomonas abietis TaxID=3012344 RepID=A0ABY7NMT0_9SPHN|nr:substrate-binding domain-containing protein [Sphingomonas abietis]WBO22825.1 substrate-binding domain-containing protein [Sphingomonas abietis]